jgi:hypothetical protein
LPSVIGELRLLRHSPAAHWRERVEANRDDPEYQLTISAPTNADTREICTAIRADRRCLGELGEDIRAVNAVDRTDEIYALRFRSSQVNPTDGTKPRCLIHINATRRAQFTSL